jgi:hypothetical protein
MWFTEAERDSLSMNLILTPMRRLFALISLLAVLLTSCAAEKVYEYEIDYSESLYLSDFSNVCDGIPMEYGTEYSAEAGTHPIALFERDSVEEGYLNTSFVFPEEWESTYQNPENTELVVCVTTVPELVVEVCDYDIEGETYTLTNYNASYEVELYEATTAELVSSISFEVLGGSCPAFWFFLEQEENNYPALEQPLIDWVEYYVQN